LSARKHWNSVEIDHKGLPTSFLNIECHWKESSLTLTQKRAIDSLSTEYGITYGASTPMSPTADLTAPDLGKENVIDPKPCQRLIGSLMYIAQTTRPDILYAVTYLARRSLSACPRHWDGAIRIARYLYGTASKGHRLRSGSQVTIWVDASYGGEEGRCQMGIVTCIGETAVGWTSQRQSVVALSTTEAEYIAISAGAQQAAWIKGFLSELGEDVTPTIITDNDGAKKLGENPGFHKRTKHINQRYHYIRQQLELGELTIEWKAGKWNKANLLTKALPAPALKRATDAVMDGHGHEHLSKGE